MFCSYMPKKVLINEMNYYLMDLNTNYHMVLVRVQWKNMIHAAQTIELAAFFSFVSTQRMNLGKSEYI